MSRHFNLVHAVYMYASRTEHGGFYHSLNAEPLDEGALYAGLYEFWLEVAW